MNAGFSYAQNVETLLITYMNSFYNYSANAHRRFGQFNIGVGASAGRTALTDQAGTENDSESFNATIGYTHWLTATGSYARAHGQALATGAGLIPVPIHPRYCRRVCWNYTAATVTGSACRARRWTSCSSLPHIPSR